MPIMYAKSVNFQEVMKVVVETVNYFRSKGLKHRQFKQFLAKMESFIWRRAVLFSHSLAE